ncbi:MAG: phosphatidylserine decarboxylase family protein [Flavobacteriaceae bacterium]|nr:phosphatidylserine decarboxylase family protein [Flavobacteriaceae bacterium]
MIHREGFASLFIAALVLGLVNIGLPYICTAEWLLTSAGILSLGLFVIVLQFFRNPSRTTVLDDSKLYAPCDGKVVVIEEVEESEYFKDRRIQVSIFMSPFNVHVNRNPASGIVKYSKYHPGKYLVAWHPKSSTENERTTIVIENPKSGKSVLFRQIAGAMARRIVNYLNEGQAVKQGAEMGFIKFGSRVDVFLPVGSKMLVNLGDKTVGGETVIAEW